MWGWSLRGEAMKLLPGHHPHLLTGSAPTHTSSLSEETGFVESSDLLRPGWSTRLVFM